MTRQKELKYRWVVVTETHHVVIDDTSTRRSYPTKFKAMAARDRAEKRYPSYTSYIVDREETK
jgi:hypothetical protein